MVYLVRIRFCRWLDRYLIYQPFAPLEARILAKRGRKEWDEATSPNSMTSLALYGLLRSLILARNAIPRIADFHDRSSRAFRYVFGYTYMYVCKITCACNLHTHVYTNIHIYTHNCADRGTWACVHENNTQKTCARAFTWSVLTSKKC